MPALGMRTACGCGCGRPSAVSPSLSIFACEAMVEHLQLLPPGHDEARAELLKQKHKSIRRQQRRRSREEASVVGGGSSSRRRPQRRRRLSRRHADLTGEASGGSGGGARGIRRRLRRQSRGEKAAVEAAALAEEAATVATSLAEEAWAEAVFVGVRGFDEVCVSHVTAAGALVVGPPSAERAVLTANHQRHQLRALFSFPWRQATKCIEERGEFQGREMHTAFIM
ncbi:hypothetical protein OsJ_21018 [Oryza sativa Japonica Group]|uniref:Uncharacterized protein n=1 Tax=Oryza sativa subsp. japonica TaxID=39947 RepID=B9FST6_ORYSJ|nr:hypothetical protein OsJ_21018 [Oryza sativa Japonica Group]